MSYSHGGNIYHNTIRADFSVNLNPLGVPQAVTDAVRESAAMIEQYPDPDQTGLRAALSDVSGIPADHLIFGNGAAELIDSYVTAVSPDTILLPEPSFSEYRRALETRHCRIIPVPMSADEGFSLNETILDQLNSSVDLIMLCTPNNPTGCLLPPDLLHRILERAFSLRIRVFLDECFILLSDHPEYAMKPSDYEKYPNLFVLRSFTKTFAMPGIRLGYGITSDTGLLQAMNRLVQPWNISVTASAAGLAALGTADHTKRAGELIRRERAFLTDLLEQAGFDVCRGQANYILFRGPETLYDMLLSRGILIRDCANYAGLTPGWYRIAVRRHEDNLMLADALREIGFRTQ